MNSEPSLNLWATGEWISVERDLPEEIDELVLVTGLRTNGSRWFDLALYSPSGNFYVPDDGTPYNPVTHWLRIPHIN